MNVYTPDMTREEAAAAAVKAVRELSVRVGIPQHLSELGIKEEDLSMLADDVLKEPVLGFNPKQGVTKEDVLDILRKAM